MHNSLSKLPKSLMPSKLRLFATCLLGLGRASDHDKSGLSKETSKVYKAGSLLKAAEPKSYPQMFQKPLIVE